MTKSSSNVDVMLRLRGARKFAKEVDRAGKDLEGMGLKGAGAMAKLAKQSQRLQDFGASMTKRVTLPIIGAGAASVTAAAKWESAFAGVRKTVDATEAEFAALDKGIREMSMEIPTSANDLAQIAEAAGQLGIETDNILGFTRVIADLGEATNIVGEEGAQQLAKFANIMQMPQKDFDRLGSTIVDLGNNFATTEADILRMGLRLAGASKQVGMSEANVMSLATAMSSVGIEAEAGGTAMSQVMTDMLSAVLGGGEKLQQFADVAGMSADKFKKLFKDDSAGAINAFVDGLGRIKGEGGDVTGTLKEMGLGGQRMVRMLLSLSGAGDVLSDALGRGDKAWKDNSALTKEAQQRYETFESRLQILRNTLTNLGVTVGNVLLPPLTTLADKLGPILIDFAEKFGSLSPTMQAVTVGIAGFLAALGPATWMLGKFAGGIGRALVLMNALAGSWKAGRLHTLRLNLALLRLRATMMLQATWTKIVTGAQWLLNAAMTANPIGLLVVGIAALVGAFVLAYHKIGWFRKGVDAVWDAIGAGISWVLGFVKRHWPKIVAILGGPMGAALVLVIKNFDKIKSAATGVKDWVTGAFNNVVGFIKDLPGRIRRAASGMWDGIKDALRGVLNWIIDKWNGTVGKLSFKAPGWVPGIGGKGFSMPTIPELPAAAEGANVVRSGAMLVGEEGPEILDFPRGARVTPLAEGGLSSAFEGLIEITVYSVLDGEKVGKGVARHVSNAGGGGMRARPELRIREQGKKAVYRFPLGDGPPTITSGLGGWETVGRRGKVALTRYVGADPLAQDIPILLDGWAKSRSVQPQINQLIRMSRPVGGDPPVLIIGGPVHRTQLKWVIANIQWGDAIQLPGIGIVRQELTLQLLQYVRPDRVRVRTRPSVGQAKQLTATARKGDTWRKLAARHLGDASRWKQLAKKNGNKPATANRGLKPGRRVRL